MNKLKLLLALSLFASCQTLRPEEMATDARSYESTFPGTVALEVGGGSGGVKWYSGTVEPEELEQAIRLSVERSGLFQGLADAASADYRLSADLVFAGSHPGFNLSAWLTIAWSLTSVRDNAKLWEAELKGEGEATVGEAFNATTRQYIALERAGKANIQQALEALSQQAP